MTPVAQKVSTPAVALYEAVRDFRSDAAIEYYMRDYGLSRETAEEHFAEVVKYLCLVTSYDDESLTPSDQLDEVWHAFLIQTREYAEFSARLGRFVHHNTMPSPQFGAYDRALELYQDNFGDPHLVWRLPKQSRPGYLAAEDDCDECVVVGWCSTGD